MTSTFSDPNAWVRGGASAQMIPSILDGLVRSCIRWHRWLVALRARLYHSFRPAARRLVATGEAAQAQS